MLRNLVSSLIEHDQITTTVAKAKETARLADKLITLCKRASLPSEIDSLPESGSSKRQPRGGKDRHYKNLANEFLLVRFSPAFGLLTAPKECSFTAGLPAESKSYALQALQ